MYHIAPPTVMRDLARPEDRRRSVRDKQTATAVRARRPIRWAARLRRARRTAGAAGPCVPGCDPLLP